MNQIATPRGDTFAGQMLFAWAPPGAALNLIGELVAVFGALICCRIQRLRPCGRTFIDVFKHVRRSRGRKVLLHEMGRGAHGLMSGMMCCSLDSGWAPQAPGQVWIQAMAKSVWGNLMGVAIGGPFMEGHR